MLVLMDAGITSGGFLEHAAKRSERMPLGALEAGVWETRRAGHAAWPMARCWPGSPPVAQPGALSGAARRVGTHHLLSRDR